MGKASSTKVSLSAVKLKTFHIFDLDVLEVSPLN
jgi:hypothetical protein